MKPILRLASLLIPVMGGAFAAVMIAPTPVAAQSDASTPRSDTIVKTMELRYVLASHVIRLLQSKPDSKEAEKSNPMLSPSITLLSAKDADNTLTISGTRQAVESLEAKIRLLDVKPRMVTVELRLIEIRLAADGTPKETLLQSPIISTTNNIPATISLMDPNQSGTKIAVLPHINGDGTIALQVSVTLQRASDKTKPAPQNNSFARRAKPGEWLAFRPITLSGDTEIQKSVRSGTEPIPAVAYPLYRIEASASEISTP